LKWFCLAELKVELYVTGYLDGTSCLNGSEVGDGSVWLGVLKAERCMGLVFLEMLAADGTSVKVVNG